MIRLRGGQVVLADRLLSEGAVTLEDGVVVDVGPAAETSAADIDCRGCWILPGFIDVHVHGACGTDVLGDADGVRTVAATLPRFGVTSFCPTTMACTPDALDRFLQAVEHAGLAPAPHASRVLGAHLESNFINPEFAGAQPVECLRRPPAPHDPLDASGTFTGAAILSVIEARRAGVRLVTLAPELGGAEHLIRRLVAAGHRVSLGHSAATFEQAVAAIDWGARHATHLFNRMPPLSHRAPGLAGAALAHDAITAEIICDGVHVHPALVRMAVRAKGPSGVLAITDGTAGAGLPLGSAARLGDASIRVTDRGARLPDGTLAGSVATMDQVFRMLVGPVGLSVADASRLCSRTPADALDRPDLGRIAVGQAADLVVLDAAFTVRHTWIGGRLVWNSDPKGPVSASVSPA